MDAWVAPFSPGSPRRKANIRQGDEQRGAANESAEETAHDKDARADPIVIGSARKTLKTI